jgi:receptor expression-enhancing protein 5/6
MAQFQTYKEKLNKALHEKNPFTDVLAKIEAKTKVDRLYITLGIAGVLALYLLVGYGAEFLANFIGFLYPAYASIKAVESLQKDDDTKWLTYWVVYAFFSLLEFFTDIFLFWIPFYAFFKCLFLMFCMVPTKWNGSLMIYNQIIKPLFLKHQTKIDKGLAKASAIAGEVVDTAIDEGAKAYKDHLTKSE